MTREEAKKIILKHQFAFASMPYEVIKAVSYLIEEQEPFINKPCVSSGVCEHDKQKVLDKIRAEIEKEAFTDINDSKFIFVNHVNQILDKYKAESEVDNGNDD